MNVLDLFSGIGGFSLGLERAGMRTIAFCEIDPYCRAVLRKHWPDVPIYEDVRTLPAIDADLICGGFPCQDLSLAGRGAGLAGTRSGLWRDMARAIGLVGPRYVIVENVAALLGRGLGVVLGDLAALGYDAEWHCIPASAVGAPHRRDRIWIIAYPGHWYVSERTRPEGRGDWERAAKRRVFGCAGAIRLVADGADADGPRLALGQGIAGDDGEECATAFGGDWWRVEPDVGRVADGVPSRVDRLRALGNAVVPQIPELIGRAIMEAEA